MLPKISIIVPVYNVEDYLDRCIQSIVDQTYSNLEIILVDDGSPDRCGQICDEWSHRDSRVKVIHQENAGVSVTRNAGISMAQGEYLYFVDSDDWIAPNLCEKAMEAFSEHDADIVVFGWDQVTETGKSLGSTETLTEGSFSTEEALRELLQGHINSYLWNKIYKRSVFQDIWLPNRTAFEDMAITYKLFLNASKIYCMEETLYFYYRRSGSATARLSSRKLCELYQSRWECYTALKPLYPGIAELAFPYLALVARRLYDRSLWEPVDEDVFAAAMTFLQENKARILETERDFSYRMYYAFPWGYKMLRLGKHYAGDAVRSLRKLAKRA